MCAAPADLVEDGGDDPAVQDAGVALEVLGRGVGGLDDARLGLIDMQVQPDGILEAADEAHARIGLFGSRHGGDYTHMQSKAHGSLIGIVYNSLHVSIGYL